MAAGRTYDSRDPDGHREKLRSIMLTLSQWQDTHEFVPFVQDNAYGIRSLLNDTRADIHMYLADTAPNLDTLPEDPT